MFYIVNLHWKKQETVRENGQLLHYEYDKYE